ncbi:MAG: tetratricopeptide repeat protein, partial [Myxococcota bacterium]
ELGTRYGLITPFTSYYVPSARELAQLPGVHHLIDRPLLRFAARKERPTPAFAPFGFLSYVAGCNDPEAQTQTADGVLSESPEEASDETVATASAEPAPEALAPPAEPMDSPNEAMERARQAPPATTAPAVPPIGGEFGEDDDPGSGRWEEPIEEEAEARAEPEPNIPTGRAGGGGSRAPQRRGPRMATRGPLDDFDNLDQGSNEAAQANSIAPQSEATGRAEDIRNSGFDAMVGRLGDGEAADLLATGTRTAADRLAEADENRRPTNRPRGRREEVERITIEIERRTTHRAQRCSDAAGRMLDDRRALWRERLQNASNATGWVEVYRRAIRNCEAPTYRDRRALLQLLLARAGSIQAMLQLYQYLSDGSGRSWLRRAILRRVRSPEDLRRVREVFGVHRGLDWDLVNQVLARATTPTARVRALRELVTDYPENFELKLQLLETLEATDRFAEARRLADAMRADPLADAGVRTAIGEMFMRIGDEEEARRVFSEIVEFAPYDELSRRRLGDLYRAHGWFEDAYRQYLTLSEIRPDDPTVFLLLAQAAAGAGRVDEALRLEQRLAETAQPGATQGVARTAVLWSSVRFAKLRKDADAERRAALLARMRRSGVLREAGAFRASLTWSHPDAQLSLWASHSSLSLSRPRDIAPEYGLEAFDVDGFDGSYKLEVRRAEPGAGRTQLTPVEAELVLVWNEGSDDERIEVVPLRFEGDRLALAWTVTEADFSEAPISERGRR